MSSTDLTTIKARWESDLRDTQLALTPDNGAADTLMRFLRGLPSGRLALQSPNIALSDAGDELTLQGGLGGEHWPCLLYTSWSMTWASIGSMLL